jgi:inorganic pyrophosphatase/exopolyphosphatase
METGYFYSKSTGLYVAREPLKIDARVIKAALDCGIQLNWDEEGRINYISLYGSLDLLQKLGATMLTLKDYWLVLRDAIEANDVQMIKELQSDRYTEWLNTLIEKKEHIITNLSVQRKGENYRYQGKKLQVQMPFGHPGWFEPKDIDLETGLPQKVELNREKHSTTWKYWSFCDYNYTAAAVRGWVTSVGKPSLDLGIPAGAVYPVLLLRECRKELLQPPVDARVLKEITALISDYEELARQNNYQKFYAKRETFLRFIFEHGTKFQQSREMEIYKIREKIGEIIGILRVIAKNEKDILTLKIINQIARKIWKLKQSKIEFRNFLAFVQSSRKRLEKAISALKPIVFVIGHNNPDTDTVISALAEAFRNHLVDGDKTTYVPVVQGERIPDEAKRLLGERLSQSILLSSDTLYKKVKISGQARWIMVDHNKNSEIQKFAVSIIDHHTPSEIALKQNISKTLEMIGSTTALIVQKINGLGIDIAQRLSHIFYGATLMDTENRSELKMTQKDRLIMDDLKKTSGTKSDAEFYRDLMNFLLSTDDIRLLFARDYKEDWAFFGFAVAKVKGVFDEKGTVQKKETLNGLMELARQNNAEKNLPLTIVKIVDYKDDNETINRERIYLIFNERVFPEFKKTMFDLVSTLISFTFKGKACIRKTSDFIEFWGTGKQLSRKRTAPFLELIAIAFNEYFYSPTARLYVKRDFLKATKRVKEAAKKCRIHLSWDEKRRINNITYGEAIQLLEYLGFTAMSLRDYWIVLADAKSFKDQQMLLHLKSSGFVEFLHTIIEDGKYAIEKPRILEAKSIFQYEGVEVAVSYSYEGQKQTIDVLKGTPGLINPKDIESKTGLPKIVHPPDIYKNPHLWRYWSPDAEKNVATRSYIFLLGQPALDLKVHLSESFDCLGIRPCCEKVELPEVKIIESDEGIALIIKKEGETTKIQGKEFFEKGSN